MKGQTYAILSIIFIIIISVFAVLNMEIIEVNYLFWQGSSPLIFVILFSVLLGGILTTVVGSKKFFSLKRENKLLREKLTTYEIENEIPNSVIAIEEENETEEKNGRIEEK